MVNGDTIQVTDFVTQNNTMVAIHTRCPILFMHILSSANLEQSPW